MQWVSNGPGSGPVTEIKYRIIDGQCVLTWRWPEGIQFVYIYRFEFGKEKTAKERTEAMMRLYSREEYKARSGYWSRIDPFGLHCYRIYPCVRDDGGNIIVFEQEDDENYIQFVVHKAKIRFSITYSKVWFTNKKKVRIQIRSDTQVPKEALCYVKKEGSVPLHNEDGIQYPFPHDFNPGMNPFPPIEINRNDFIKLFLADGNRYGDCFDLIPE